jgi:hypothetical protein
MDRSDIARRVDQDTALRFCFAHLTKAVAQTLVKIVFEALEAIVKALPGALCGAAQTFRDRQIEDHG